MFATPEGEHDHRPPRQGRLDDARLTLPTSSVPPLELSYIHYHLARAAWYVVRCRNRGLWVFLVNDYYVPPSARSL